MLEILNNCHDLTKYLADIPDEATAAAKWREFMEKASSAQSNAGEGAVAHAGYSAAPNPNYAPRNTTKVSAAEFLDADADLVSAPAKEPDADELLVSEAAEAPVKKSAPGNWAKPAAKPAAAASEMSNQLPEGDDDDTELPF